MPAAVISTCSCLMSPPLLLWICPLCRPFIKWPNVCFLALWHRWHRSGCADPLSEMFTVIVLGYLQQAHCPIHFLVQKNNKQTAKPMAAKSGKRLTVTVGSNHPGSSSNSLLLSPSHLSDPPISASFSTYLTNLCVLVCAWPCNACAFCDCTWVVLYVVCVLLSSRGGRCTRTFWAGVRHLLPLSLKDSWNPPRPPCSTS